MPTSLRLTVLAALVSGMTGCALFERAADTAVDDAHVVFLTRPPCPHVVVKTQGDRFGLLQPVEPVALRQGDIFVGPLRPGTVALRFVPFPGEVMGQPRSVEVHAAGLVLADAQTLWREACGEG